MIWDVFFQGVSLPPHGEMRDKYYVVVSADPLLCLLINTEASWFDRNNPELLQGCYATITRARHSFLDRDSLVSCTKCFSHFVPTPADRVGQIHVSERTRIIETVISCPKLIRGSKTTLIQTHSAIAQPILDAITRKVA